MGDQIVTTEIKRFIIACSIHGKTSEKIAEEIFLQFQVPISPQTVRYHRGKNADQILKQQSDQLSRAYAMEPIAALENRLGMFQRNIDCELDKKRPDRRVVNDAIRFAAEDIRELEKIRIKQEELRLRSAGDEKPNIDEISLTIEKKITYSLKKRKSNEELAELAGWSEEA